MNQIRWETVLSYVLSEGIQLRSLLKIWGLLGKKMLNERVDESKIEEWSKYVVNERRRVFVYEREAIGKKRA